MHRLQPICRQNSPVDCALKVSQKLRHNSQGQRKRDDLVCRRKINFNVSSGDRRATRLDYRESIRNIPNRSDFVKGELTIRRVETHRHQCRNAVMTGASKQ